jgi:hypothetical protein
MSVETTEIIVPSSPADILDIFKVIKQISDSKTRAKGESDYQKETLNALAEKYSIDVKFLRQMANDYHKDTFDKKSNEFDNYQHLYETVITRGNQLYKPGQPLSASTVVSDEEE